MMLTARVVAIVARKDGTISRREYLIINIPGPDALKDN